MVKIKLSDMRLKIFELYSKKYRKTPSSNFNIKLWSFLDKISKEVLKY